MTIVLIVFKFVWADIIEILYVNIEFSFQGELSDSTGESICNNLRIRFSKNKIYVSLVTN